MAGLLCQTTSSQPFGDDALTSTPSGVPNCSLSPDFLTGKPRDSESNLDDFGARYLSSQFGRWMSPDWSAAPSGVPYAAYTNPQSLNLYAYVGNDPVDGEDPDGHRESFRFPSSFGIATGMTQNEIADLLYVEAGLYDSSNGTSSSSNTDGTQNTNQNSETTPAGAPLTESDAADDTTPGSDPGGQAQSQSAAKASAQSAGAVSSEKIGKVWFNAYGGSAAERSAQLAAMSQDLTTTDRGGEMLKALEGRKSGFLGLWGDPKPFDIIQWSNPLGSYSTQGGNFIVLDPSQIGMPVIPIGDGRGNLLFAADFRS